MRLLRQFMQGIGSIVLTITTITSTGCGSARASSPQKPLSSGIKRTVISTCGTVINTPGIYGVDTSLSTTSTTVDCIQITSAGVNLGIASQISISGPGGAGIKAAGVHILSSASGVAINMTGATIQGFAIGLLVEGAGVSISGSSTGGIVTGNMAQGILISGASNVLIDSLLSQKNGGSGVEVLSSSGVTMRGVNTLQENGGYGLWVHSSSWNQFFDLNAFSNQLDGIFVGELNTDKLAASHNNVFLDLGAIQNSRNGISIGMGETNNVVTASAA